MSLLKLIQHQSYLRYIDLFCGIGGFRIAINQVCQEYEIKCKCVFSCDIDADAKRNYYTNFKEHPYGDITKINAEIIPDHDLLLAGFPCQPFSICGYLKGFEDTRGTLFFDIARILKEKKPYAFILENVKQLLGHKQGETLKIIVGILEELGYHVNYKVLNALNFGVPQKRERIFIVGLRENFNFQWPHPEEKKIKLKDILESKVANKYYASADIRQKRLARYKGNIENKPTIWHENKAGNISVYPYSCAMRAGASYNYLLVNGERRLTEREMLRLQGFPESFQLLGSYSIVRKLVGNSVAIPCVTAVIRSLFKATCNYDTQSNQTKYTQLSLFSVNTMEIEAAKVRLDRIINKTRTRFYKPIQIAEVLYRSRVVQDIDIFKQETYRIRSKEWRNIISKRLLNQYSTSSSRFQDDIWNNNAMPPNILKILDQENKNNAGVVEFYIYQRLIERQGTIISIIEKVKSYQDKPDKLYLKELLSLFRNKSGLKRSIDKCYEIITYSLFETIVRGLEVQINIKVNPQKSEMLKEFQELVKVLLNLDSENLEWSELAHIYRVGVTNAADRGLDMWANFGPAIQVKHITVDENDVEQIVEQVESDHIIIVCRDTDAKIIQTIMRQISWGRRVRGIVTEAQLSKWYDLCLRGQFSPNLSSILVNLLIQSFENEFPEATNQAKIIKEFCQERNYHQIDIPEIWQIDI